MTKLVIFQHVPYEILGTLHPLLKAAGFRIKYVNFGRHPHAQPNLNKADGLVILGGPMSATEYNVYPHLAVEMRAIEQALAKNIPILGICLGAQLVAQVLGATIKVSQTNEIGWHDVSLTEAGRHDPLLRNFVNHQKIFHWHTDTFTIPNSAKHLAYSERCTQQAFCYNSNVYGFQFHMEVDEQLIERWVSVPLYQDDMANANTNVSAIANDTKRYINTLKQLSTQTFCEFIKLFPNTRNKYYMLTT